MSQEIPAAVQRALTAIDEQDNDVFVAAFAADGYVDDWGRQFRATTGSAPGARTS